MRARAAFPFAALAVACIDHSPSIALQPTVPPTAATAAQQAPAGAAATPSEVTIVAGNSSPPLPLPAPSSSTATPRDGARTWGATPDRWRTALDGYVSVVRPGNQTPLNAARVPFATYLNAMHNRIHPIFTGSFLRSLHSLPPDDPLNDEHLVTFLEIVLTEEGHLKQLGVIRTSGITAFDIAALDAVDRAQPFGQAPSAIQSADGNVYVQWEFHRHEVYACSTMGSRPFILSGSPLLAAPHVSSDQ